MREWQGWWRAAGNELWRKAISMQTPLLRNEKTHQFDGSIEGDRWNWTLALLISSWNNLPHCQQEGIQRKIFKSWNQLNIYKNLFSHRMVGFMEVRDICLHLFKLSVGAIDALAGFGELPGGDSYVWCIELYTRTSNPALKW